MKTANTSDGADACSALLLECRRNQPFGTATPVSSSNHKNSGITKHNTEEKEQNMNPQENKNETAPVAAGAASDSKQSVAEDKMFESNACVSANAPEAKSNVGPDAVSETPCMKSGSRLPKRAIDTSGGEQGLEMRVDQLRPHERNDEIYGKGSIVDLVKSIKAFGAIIEPLLVTADGTIIGGHRRYRAAQELKLETVPVRVFDSADDLEILSALLEHNRQRVKSKSQIAAECELQMEIEKGRRDRKARNGAKDAGATLPPTAAKKSRDAVSKAQGISPRSVDKATKASQAVKQLKAEGREADAAEVATALDKGFDAGYKAAVKKGVVKIKKPKAAAPVVDIEVEVLPNANRTEEMASEVSGGAEPSDKIGKPALDSDMALTQLDEVLTFLRGVGSDDLTDQQKRDWEKLFDQLDNCRANLDL